MRPSVSQRIQHDKAQARSRQFRTSRLPLQQCPRISRIGPLKQRLWRQDDETLYHLTEFPYIDGAYRNISQKFSRPPYYHAHLAPVTIPSGSASFFRHTLSYRKDTLICINGNPCISCSRLHQKCGSSNLCFQSTTRGGLFSFDLLTSQ